MAMAVAIAAGAANRVEPLRVLVLVDGEGERQLAARVEGQTTDLDTFIITTEAPAGLSPEAKAERARGDGVTHRAEVVVWFLAEGDGWVVNVAHGDDRLQRRVAESSGALSSSASTEAVALVVRTALRGIAIGAPPPPRTPEAPPVPVRFWGALGWTAVLDGSGNPGHHGGEARAGAAVGSWQVLLELAYQPGESIRSADATPGVPTTTIAVDRLAVGLVGGYELLRGSWWRLGAEFGGAAVRYSRSTTELADNFKATPPRASWSPTLRPAFSFSAHLGWAVWAVLAAGADVVFARPQFEVNDAGVFKHISTLWAVEPRVSLTLVIDVL